MEMEHEVEEKVNIDNNAPSTKKSVKKNYLYNLIYQMFLVIVPLVVTPYISRVLTKSGVGKYSFSFSLITYFTIFGALGFGYYAQREIARWQGNKNRQAISFWEINICRLIPVSIALILNVILCIINVYGSYNNLMWIFNINIIALGFDIVFYFQGNEEFSKIVIRNLIIKSLSIAAIFLFVKDEGDLWLYALINSLSIIISNFSLWAYVPKYIGIPRGEKLKPLKHLNGTLILFIPTVAISIYTVLDKTLIGILIKGEETIIEDGSEVIKKTSDIENGYYEQAEKIVKMIMTVITAIGTVMIPRNTHEIEVGNDIKVKDNLKLSSRLVFLIGIPLTLGVISLSPWFVPWFFGAGYEKCVILMQILAPLIIIIGLSNVYGLQCLVPYGKDRTFTACVTLGALVNLVLNIIFIHFWMSKGAAVATIIAESVVTLSMAFMVRKSVNIFKTIILSWRYIIAGALMFLALYFIGRNFFEAHNILNTFILTLIGMASYGIVLLILVDPLIYKYVNIIIRKVIRK